MFSLVGWYGTEHQTKSKKASLGQKPLIVLSCCRQQFTQVTNQHHVTLKCRYNNNNVNELKSKNTKLQCFAMIYLIYQELNFENKDAKQQLFLPVGGNCNFYTVQGECKPWRSYQTMPYRPIPYHTHFEISSFFNCVMTYFNEVVLCIGTEVNGIDVVLLVVMLADLTFMIWCVIYRGI